MDIIVCMSTFDDNNIKLKPFYMWAGGKTRLLKYYRPIINTIMRDHNHIMEYVEPFFGGGALYADMWNLYNNDLLYAVNDVNTELMELLAVVKSDKVNDFMSACKQYADEMLALDGKENRKTWYYDLRKRYWMQHDSMVSWERSAMLFILMRTGFNGIWQSCVEANGLFATPAGLLNQTKVKQLFDESMLTGWHDALQHTVIHTGSYTDVNTESMQSGKALIYLDPPYRHSFTTYGTGFNDEDQKALCEWMITMHDAGNIIMMSNRTEDDDSFFKDLLPMATFHDFDITYTAGRRKKHDDGSFTAKPAHEFLCVMD